MKILIIGQAPPDVDQKVPYDTTLLYQMLLWVGITKEQAQEMFEFEAVSNKFPGKNAKGGHLKPSKVDMDDHWEVSLKNKVLSSLKVIILGRVAAEYLFLQTQGWATAIKVLELPHPSRRNYSLIMGKKENITEALKWFIQEMDLKFGGSRKFFWWEEGCEIKETSETNATVGKPVTIQLNKDSYDKK